MLHLNDITFRLGPRVLFDKAGAALPDGARVGFVGRNGTGKTTLFRMIAGELAPESGTISIPRRMRLGRVVRYDPNDVQNYLEGCRVSVSDPQERRHK